VSKSPDFGHGTPNHDSTLSQRHGGHAIPGSHLMQIDVTLNIDQFNKSAVDAMLD
jgi:hypothetical protein